MKIGFLGLGNLGFAMAKRLKEKDADLTVWNRTPAKSAMLGVPVAFSPAELLSGSDVVFLNLFDSAAVDHVLTMPDGLLQGDCAGKIVIDTTTNHPARVGEFHRLLEAKSGRYLEAPVLGSVGPASQGTLTMVASGKREVLEQVRPAVQLLCKEIFFVGGPGVATRMKLINNLVLGSFMATLAEAVAAGKKAGIDPEAVLTILAAGAGNSTVLQAKRAKLLQGDFSPQFSVSAILKDLTYLTDLFSAIGIDSANLGLLRERYQNAIDLGLANDDFSAVYRVYQESP